MITMIRLQRLSILLALVLLLYLGSAAATQCHQDNCYRALENRPAAATSFCQTFTRTLNLPIPTASPPPFTSQCANQASRISSACSCVVYAPTPTGGICEPTPALDTARNGGFDQIFVPEGGAIETMPPWYFDRMQGARGDFIRLPPNMNGETETGYGAAAWHIESGEFPSTDNGGFLNAPISICSGKTYEISFWGRVESTNPDPYFPSCFATISSRMMGEIGGARLARPDNGRLFKYSGWSYTPFVDPIVNGVGKGGSVYKERGYDFEGRGWKGYGWNDTISIEMRCEDSPVPMVAIVDAVRIA